MRRSWAALLVLLPACEATTPPPATPFVSSVAVTPRPPHPYYEPSAAAAADPSPAVPPVVPRFDESPVPGAWRWGARGLHAGAPIDLDLRDVDITDVCRLLADVGRVNIVVSDDVHGQVTVKMTRVPWDTALDVILRAKGLVAESLGDVILVRAR